MPSNGTTSGSGEGDASGSAGSGNGAGNGGGDMQPANPGGMNGGGQGVLVLGAACAQAGDCGGEGVCLSSLPGGYCSKRCSDNSDCPGGTCWDVGEETKSASSRVVQVMSAAAMKDISVIRHDMLSR